MVVELKEIEHSSEIPRTLWNSLVDIDSYLDFWLIYRYYLFFNALWSNLLEMIGFFNALHHKEQQSPFYSLEWHLRTNKLTYLRDKLRMSRKPHLLKLSAKENSLIALILLVTMRQLQITWRIIITSPTDIVLISTLLKKS